MPVVVRTVTSVCSGVGTVGRTVFLSSRMDSSWRSNECLEEIRFGGHQRVHPHCHGLDVSLERFSLLECAPDCIVVGLRGCRGFREFSVRRRAWPHLATRAPWPPWLHMQRCRWKPTSRVL